MSTLFYLKSAAKGTERSYPPSRPYQRRQQQPKEKEVVLDFNADPKEVVNTILHHISQKDGITKAKRLAYLNAFVKFMQYKTTASSRLTFDITRIFICLRVSLIQEAPVIRIAALRVLRHLIRHEGDVIIANSLGIPTLVARSIDIVLNNSGERIQAIRLCQKILSIPSGANHFPIPITRALISIGFDGQVDRDKLHRSSLSILCQLALLNPLQFISCGGVRVLLHNIFGCLSPMVLEGILGSLFHLLNFPLTRDLAGINLQGLVAPLTDLHFKHTGYQNPDGEMDEREMGYRSSKIAIGILLRSWSGLGSFCKSGLQALIDSLYIEQFEIRRTILDLLCEIIGLQFPTWTDEVRVAIAAVDPSHPRDSWKLQEGFIVEESISILPHLANFTPNITANHTGLLILCLVRSGLLEALVEVILTSDTFISVRATVLLGELLCLSDHFLPTDCFDPAQSIPSLIEHAMGSSKVNDPISSNSAFASSSLTPQMKQQRAMEAITVLSLLHDVKAKTPTPSSMFLQMQMSFAGFSRKSNQVFLDRLGELQLNRILRKEVDSNPTKLLKETLVLASKDPMSWNWETICCLLRWSPPPLKRIEDNSWRLFLKRLVEFFKPSTNNFDRLELDKENSKLFAQVGCTLFQFLADSVQNFTGSVLLEEIVVDIAVHLDDLLRRKENPHLALWSPSKMETTLSQSYFLFIGKLSRSTNGIRVLRKADIVQRLVDVIREVRHENYVKLIVSSLYYGDEYSRQVLNVVLSSPNDRNRIYATKFLRILVRVKPHNFSKWGAQFLVDRLGDTNPVIALTALDILEEAVHDKLFLESLIALRPSFAKFGDRGLLLQVSFTSLPSGYKYLHESKLLEKEIRYWKQTFNKRYVEVVEVLIRDSVSTLRRGDDGKYPERASKFSEQSKFKDIFVPPHIYGQLAQHKAGFDMLIEQGEINELIDVVHKSNCETVEETRQLKAALWSLSHFATSLDGLSVLDNHEIIEAIVNLGSTCPMLSVRHTVFHCLCVIASTQAGADNLRRFGWITMPRSHHEAYPIWGSSIPRVNRSLCRLRELDFDLEQEESKSKPPWRENHPELSSSPPENLNTTLGDERQMWLMSESPPVQERLDCCDGFKDADVVDSAPPTATPKHSFSRSIRKRLSSFTSNLSGGSGNNNSVDDSELREYRLSNFANWRIAKSRSESGAEPGRLGDLDSLSLGASPPNLYSSPGGTGSDFVQTLSPIASAASIAVTPGPIAQRHSVCSSSFRENAEGTSGFDEFLPEKVPSFYRSVIRKPIIRIPTTSPGSDIFPMHLSPPRRMSLREIKTGSLDRHNFQLTPRDLFNESKLKRVNTSLTSLSTPSYRSCPDQGSKGPCFMGFCLPRELNMIFIMDSNRRFQTSFSRNVKAGSGAGSSEEVLLHKLPKTPLRSLRPGRIDLESEAYRSIHLEIMRLVSNMISCIGVKATEQGLLRLKQKYPKSYQDLGTYCDVCDLISEYNVRLPLRRFLQELFLDLSYEEIYAAAEAELRSGKNVTGPTTPHLAKTECLEEEDDKDNEVGKEINISDDEDSNYIDLK